jgi:activator of 2-hydroxyglutaryl-CoA dehydratase
MLRTEPLRMPFTCTSSLVDSPPVCGNVTCQTRTRLASENSFPVRFRIGIDVGSTTVKAVVVEDLSDEILWQDYRRHDTRQAEMLLDFLVRMEREIGVDQDNSRAS